MTVLPYKFTIYCGRLYHRFDVGFRIFTLLLSVKAFYLRTVCKEHNRTLGTFYHVHGDWRCTVTGVAHSPHWVAVANHAMKCLHETCVEAHHTWVTCTQEQNSLKCILCYYFFHTSFVALLLRANVMSELMICR